MRTKVFFATSLTLLLSTVALVACAPTEEEIIQGAWETAATQSAGTQAARTSRTYFLEDLNNWNAPNLVGSSLGGSVDQMIYPASDDGIPTAFGANPTNGDIAYVKNNRTDGLSIEVFSPEERSTVELVPPDAFGTTGVGIMLQYSPDGSYLALTAATLPTGIAPIDVYSEDTKFSEEQLAEIHYNAYVVNTSDGTMTQILGPQEVAFQMVDWNQSSSKVALNGWTDDNGDGKINMYPDKGTTQFSDSTQIYTYDVATNTTTQISTAELNYAPTYIGDQLFWLNFDRTRNIGIIKLEPGSVYGTPNVIIGMAASPDNTQVAWIELPMNEDRTAVTGSPILQVAGTALEDFHEPRTVAELPDMIVPDAPKWTSDGQSVLIGSANWLNGMSGDLSQTFGVTLPGEPTDVPTVLKVDVASGQITPIYTGNIVNSSNWAGRMSLIASGVLE